MIIVHIDSKINPSVCGSFEKKESRSITSACAIPAAFTHRLWSLIQYIYILFNAVDAFLYFGLFLSSPIFSSPSAHRWGRTSSAQLGSPLKPSLHPHSEPNHILQLITHQLDQISLIKPASSLMIYFGLHRRHMQEMMRSRQNRSLHVDSIPALCF